MSMGLLLLYSVTAPAWWRVCFQGPSTACRQDFAVQVLHKLLRYAGSTDGSETGSDGGSPLGPKGGGTLKTCAICLEDYRHGSGYVCTDSCICCARDDLIA